MGQPYKDFWGLTFREIHLILRAVNEAEVRRVRTRRSLNYELAALVRLGHHDPKNFPDFDEFIGNQRRVEMPPDALKNYLMALSQRP